MIPAAIPAMNAAITGFTALNKISQAGEKGKAVFNKGANSLHALAGLGSYSDVAEMSRAEFITLVDTDCMNVEFMPEVAQSILSISCAYYMQAMSILGNTAAQRSTELLNRLNPRGTSTKWYTVESHGVNAPQDDTKMAIESYQWRLPTNHSAQVALEAHTHTAVGKLDSSVKAAVHDNANLSVGKIVNVSIDTDVPGKPFVLPVTFRLNVKNIPGKDLVTLLSNAKVGNTLVERYHAWRAGEISFVSDFLLCSDMVRERKKLMMGDRSGALAAISGAGRNKSRIGGFFRGKPNLGNSAATYVISSATAKELERQLVGNLSDFKTRQRVFETGNMLLLVVIDKQFEEITFYHRGISEYSTMRLRDIKIANKGDGPSLTDLMTAMLNGRAPSF